MREHRWPSPARNSSVVRELGAWADALSPRTMKTNGFLNRLFRRA
jgi:pilus assembly protein CpaE